MKKLQLPKSVVLPDGYKIESCLAVDLSLNSTGVAYIKKGELANYWIISEDHGFGGMKKDGKMRQHICIVKNKNDIDRLLNVWYQLYGIWKDTKPGIVVIEGYAYGARGNAMFSVGELGGVVKAWFKSMRVRLCLVPPTVVKKIITGKGNADKTTMALNVYKKLGVDFSTQYLKHGEDLCDAFALGVAFFVGVEEEKKWKKDFQLL